jgi:hypothetical protein
MPETDLAYPIGRFQAPDVIDASARGASVTHSVISQFQTVGAHEASSIFSAYVPWARVALEGTRKGDGPSSVDAFCANTLATRVAPGCVPR